MARNLTRDEIVELWDRYEAGETGAQLARRFNKTPASINARIHQAGGIRLTIPTRAERHLTMEERQEISRGLAAGESLRAIARHLRRAPSTICREVKTNGGASAYRAASAERAAEDRRQRPKVCKLTASPRLRQLVADKLEQKWSPEQIAGWLKLEHADDPELLVSHETIYRTLFIQSHGALVTVS